jgi:serine/threonine protein kinase
MTELTGKTIGQYQLIELIDQNGTTHVYKGFQPSTSRYVAVKILAPVLAGDETLVQHFKQQSELLAKYEHQHLLPIYDSGVEDNVVFRVERFVENRSLGDHLSWFYNPKDAQTLMGYIAEGIQYIHNQGLVHGNLRPSNILLNDQHQPLLTDYGLAQRAGAATDVYMSPEQIQGGAVDRRTDIYSMGVILYEVLVGEAPPAGAVVSPRAKRPDLPQGVEAVIFKAMAQNPNQRYQTATEFVKALNAALTPVVPVTPQPQPSAPQPPATPVTAPSPQKEKKDTSWVTFLLGGIFVVLLVGLAIWALTSLGGDGGEPPTEPPNQEVPTVAVPTPVPPPTEAPSNPDEGATILPVEEEGGILGNLCGSIGFVGGALLLGFVFTTRRKWKFGQPDNKD